ncbi:MAG TPA: phosphocholine cytidylyltransferase family protein [Ignavibacteria bacterium]|nr:phosphocholine cytidylyltransferase family protein [Ignavibacteria bacterium]
MHQAIILAAGTGSRLKPISDEIPKCLLKFGDSTLLELAIDNLHQSGVKQIFIVTGYKEDMIKSYLKSLTRFYDLKIDIELISNNEYESTGSAYSLLLAKDFINKNTFLLDSDVLFEQRVLTKLIDSGIDNCAAINVTSHLDEEMVKVATDMDNKIVGLSKSLEFEVSVGESTGIEHFSAYFMQNLFNILEKASDSPAFRSQHYEEFLNFIADSGDKRNSFYAIDVSDCMFMEIDTLDDYKKALVLFNNSK